MVIGSNCFSPKSDMSVDENAAENMQGKNQFSRFRILHTEEGKHFYVIYTLLMLRNADVSN